MMVQVIRLALGLVVVFLFLGCGGSGGNNEVVSTSTNNTEGCQNLYIFVTTLYQTEREREWVKYPKS